MKVRFRAGTSEVEVEGKDTKDCFTQLASAIEVFGNGECGSCGSTNITPVVRENQGNTYYELRCQNCRARLAFGQQKKDGALYPRRKGKEGEWLDGNGWVKWKPNESIEAF